MSTQPRPSGVGRRVLWLSNETPDRNGQGGQRRQYFQIKALCEAGHRVEVMTLAGDQDDRSVRKLAPVARFPGLQVRGLTRIFGRLNVAHKARSASYDALVVAHLESARWLPDKRWTQRPPTVLDIHNVYDDWYRRQGDADRAARASRELDAAIALVDVVSVCSHTELGRLRAGHALGQALVLPHGIDLQEWPQVVHHAAEIPYIALFGSWVWPPNRDGLRWFVQRVLPGLQDRVPGTVVRVAGTPVPEGIDTSRLEIVGRVPDLATFLGSAAAVAVPVLTGVGASVKYAEALASGAPVIATTDAASAHPRAPALVSDDAGEWVAWASRLARGEAIAGPDRSREFARTHLTWQETTKPLDLWLTGLT